MLHSVRHLKKKLSLGQFIGLIVVALILLGLGFSLFLVRQQQDIRQQASTFPGCTEDARICSDGSTVGRDPQNNCQFFPCPLPGSTNPDTTNPDNAGANRQGGNTGITDLEFRCNTDQQGNVICPQADQIVCDQGEIFMASNTRDMCGCATGGSCVAVDSPNAGTNLFSCTEDAKICPDGSYVGRDSSNGCAFLPCPTPDFSCTQEVKECPDGSFVGRDSENGCAFSPCPTPSPTPTPITGIDSCPRNNQGDIVCPQVDPLICDTGETAVYNTIADNCGCVTGGACVDSDIAGNCSYQQVECVTTPCNPQLVCETPPPTTSPTNTPTPSPTSTATASPSPTPTAQAQTADINGDSRVDVNDYIILARNFFKVGDNLQGDINNDGEVNLLDFVILRRQFSLF